MLNLDESNLNQKFSAQSVDRLAVNSMNFVLLNFVLFLTHTCSCFLRQITLSY